MRNLFYINCGMLYTLRPSETTYVRVVHAKRSVLLRRYSEGEIHICKRNDCVSLTNLLPMVIHVP